MGSSVSPPRWEGVASTTFFMPLHAANQSNCCMSVFVFVCVCVVSEAARCRVSVHEEHVKREGPVVHDTWHPSTGPGVSEKTGWQEGRQMEGQEGEGGV